MKKGEMMMGQVRGERRVEVGCDWMRWLFGIDPSLRAVFLPSPPHSPLSPFSSASFLLVFCLSFFLWLVASGSPYTITTTAMDASGNVRECAFEIFVPVEEHVLEVDDTVASWDFPLSLQLAEDVGFAFYTHTLQPQEGSDMAAFTVRTHAHARAIVIV